MSVSTGDTQLRGGPGRRERRYSYDEGIDEPAHLLEDEPVIFWPRNTNPLAYLLASGGHNVGIVSEPAHPGHSFRVMTKRATDHYVDPETYLAEAPHKSGSWWSEWVSWFLERSGEPTEPPPMGAAAAGYVSLCDAPGTYVLQT